MKFILDKEEIAGTSRIVRLLLVPESLGNQMDWSRTLTLAFGAAILTAMLLAGIFRVAEVPNIVVAGLAIVNAMMIGFGVAVAAAIERWGPRI